MQAGCAAISRQARERCFALNTMLNDTDIETTDIELDPLNERDIATLEEYFKSFNATKAWMVTHPEAKYESARASASRWLTKDNVKTAIQERIMGPEEAQLRISDIARGDMGVFYKVVDEWMYNPLSSYEILDEEEVMDDTKDPPEKRISYRVRHVALDMDKVMDPQYSHLIKKFTDKGDSLGIELYNAHEANKDILKVHGKLNGGSSQRENVPTSAISAAPAALLELAGLIERQRSAAVDRARAVDAEATDTRSE